MKGRVWSHGLPRCDNEAGRRAVIPTFRPPSTVLWLLRPELRQLKPKVRERQASTVGFAKRLQKRSLGPQSSLVVVASFPTNEPVVALCDLPEVAAAPVADRRAGAEAGELSKATLHVLGLADVHDRSAGDPLVAQSVDLDGGVFSLEMTASAHLDEPGLDLFGQHRILAIG